MRPQHFPANGGSGWRQPLWLGLLVLASIVFSLGLACAAPLPAFAAAAALSFGRRDALMLSGGVWLAGQIVGYAALGYPWTLDSLAWGATLGVATLAAAIAARRAATAFHQGAALAAFGTAFVAFEGLLFVAAATLLGGVAAFAPAIVGRIFAINAGAFVGLLLLNRLGTFAGFVPRPALRPA